MYHMVKKATHSIKKNHKVIQIIGIIVGVIFGLIIVFGGFFYVFLNKSLQNITIDTNDTKPSEQRLNIVDDHFKNLTPLTLLVTGYGGPGHDGAFLTDTIILATIEPKYKQIYLTSIPRDLWVPIPISSSEAPFKKINEAYSIGRDEKLYVGRDEVFKGKAGGANLIKTVVQNTTGVTVDRFLALDFKTFVGIINKLGGISVTVNTSFTDKQYPINGNADELCGRNVEELPELEKRIATDEASLVELFPCRYETLQFKKGIVPMDGSTALKFVRSRHSSEDGNDFGRSIRQKNVVSAIKDKIYSINFIPKIIPIIQEFEKGVQLDLSSDELKSILGYSQELKDYSIHSVVLTSDKDNVLKNATAPTGQYILTTKEGIGNYDSIKKYLQDSYLKIQTSTSEASLVK
jgi:polyisoprenyl-teichoic acid--peptidoglycan teichoic acid transferase